MAVAFTITLIIGTTILPVSNVIRLVLTALRQLLPPVLLALIQLSLRMKTHAIPYVNKGMYIVIYSMLTAHTRICYLYTPVHVICTPEHVI